jgi:hypothetical protein
VTGDWLEGDGLAGQAFQLADEVALAVPAVGACLVVAMAEVVITGVWVREQAPDDRQDGVADGDDRASFAAAPGDAVVALAEESVGPGRCGDDLAESGGEPGIALAGGAAFPLPGGAAVDGGELGPGDQVPGGGEAGRSVRPDGQPGDRMPGRGGHAPGPGSSRQPCSLAAREFAQPGSWRTAGFHSPRVP